MLLRNPDELDDRCPPNPADKPTCIMRSAVLQRTAELKLEAEEYSAARATYILAVSEMVANPLPSSGSLRSDVYAGFSHSSSAFNLMGCINGIIECSRQLEDYDGALLWLEEADVLDKNLELAANLRSSSFEWSQTEISSADYYFERLTTLCLAAEIFLSLGNTGNAVHRRYLASEMSYYLPTKLQQTVGFTPRAGSNLLVLRHPDPRTAPTVKIEEPGLQVCGSWQKLSIDKPLGSRSGSAVFAFNGKLYVLGGETAKEPRRDFWMLDLANLDGWKELPKFPIPEKFTHNLFGYKMVPDSAGRAFVFMGLEICTAMFDTKRHKWSILQTTFVPDAQAPEWPYNPQHLIEYTAQCVGDRLYVFGGIHKGSIIGTDLFMELNIPTGKWRRLSGTAVPRPGAVGPGPRDHCHSWVGKDKDGRPFYSHAYGDLWSWDIKAEQWTQERLRGNVPSPRAEASCTYSPALDKVIVFGGYSPSVPTWFDDIEDMVGYTYYADTFIGDLNSDSATRAPIAWKQVLTRGFPTYRAEATLVTDTKTGKIFLFGGYKNTYYVRSKNTAASSRAFADLWQLRLDIPGGYFAGVDLDEEARTASAGPWQRCFACGETGPWKRCGGACGGRVFFCDSDCLKEGWKEHKEMHGCRKT
ncbi:hypothetical protein B0H17DRAFT_541126 [Mycena rosella]|uniref:MYND-type domain-containing protein n=1 Tax=Mycena rosella TaxID=1033263 RepID=A0AAD7GFN1_MYCRO|nr:hypothetical protein B0H17DRAFT_541126 [Mycena rosella]